MAGGTHTWQASVWLGGVAVSARLRGELWHQQAESAAHLARVRLAPASSDPWAEVAAAMGQALVISVQWTGQTAQPWFAGSVTEATYDGSDLVLEGSDNLQEWAEAQTEAAIDAAVTGSQRTREVQGERTDGWNQLLLALRTVRASYQIGRDGVHRVRAWAPAATPDRTLTVTDLVSDGVQRVPLAVRDRVNRVIWRVSVRGVRLSSWLIDAGWGSGQTYAQWAADPWERPLVAACAEAITGAGPVYRASGTVGAGAGDAGGITYTHPQYSEESTDLDPTLCVAAAWTWELRSRQLVELAYTITVECAASQAAILAANAADPAAGVRVDERDAALDRSSEFAGWESSADGRPDADGWVSAPGGAEWFNVPPDDEAAVLASCLAEADAAIAATHRESVQVAALPWAVDALDLYHTVAVPTGTGTWVGVVSAIEGTYDVSTWAAETTLTVTRLLPLTEGAEDALEVPERPTIPQTYSLDTDITFPLRIGGRDEAPLYDGSWMGVTTNYTTVDAEAPVYPRRCRFERPAVPDGARSSLTVEAAATYHRRLVHA